MTVKYLPGFALIGTYSTAGDGSLTPSAVSALHPTATVEIGQYIAPNTPVFVLWNCLNIVQVQITGDNGIDPPFDSGLIDTTGLLSGSLDIVNGFTSDIILTFTAYDTIGHIAVVQDLMALYPPP